jgi:inorganic pyrophosphatase
MASAQRNPGAAAKKRAKDPGKRVRIVVETPKGSRNKFKWDEKTGRFALSKLLPEGMVFPYDFGFFPDTKGEDGDPLDALILGEEPTFPGCQIDCRLIGVLKAKQKEEGRPEGQGVRNDRLIAVAEASVLFVGISELAEVEPAVLQQIEDFFINYQRVREIEYTVLAREGSTEAKKLLHRAQRS